jgi:hypothetical protein
MPYDMLVKLCTDFYSEEDIECAKDVLHESIHFTREASRRRIKRRGDSKKLHDFQDIMNAFLEFPTQDVPIYVCRDLHNLPPLSMNNFDMSGLIRNVEQFQQQVKILQDSHQTTTKAQLVISERLAQQAQPNTTPPSHTVVQTKVKCPPIPGKPTPSMNIPEVIHRSIFSDASSSSDSDDNVRMGSDDDILRLARIQGLIPEPTTQRTGRRRYSDVTRNGPPRRPSHHHQSRLNHTTGHKNGSGSDAHHTKHTSHAPDIVRGTGNSFHLRASGRTDANEVVHSRLSTGLFVSRLAKSTKPSHVERHIQSETGLIVKCEALVTKYDTYKSFYVRLTRKDQSQLMVSELWPKGIIVRPYYE